jgi:hypothetical protein
MADPIVLDAPPRASKRFPQVPMRGTATGKAATARSARGGTAEGFARLRDALELASHRAGAMRSPGRWVPVMAACRTGKRPPRIVGDPA